MAKTAEWSVRRECSQQPSTRGVPPASAEFAPHDRALLYDLQRRKIAPDWLRQHSMAIRLRQLRGEAKVRRGLRADRFEVS